MSKDYTNPTKVITGVNTHAGLMLIFGIKNLSTEALRNIVSTSDSKIRYSNGKQNQECYWGCLQGGRKQAERQRQICPALSVLKTPLRDGDAERRAPEYEPRSDSQPAAAWAEQQPGRPHRRSETRARYRDPGHRSPIQSKFLYQMDRSLEQQSFQNTPAYRLHHVFHFRLISFPLQNLHGDNIVDLEVENNSGYNKFLIQFFRTCQCRRMRSWKKYRKERKIYSNRNDE